MLLFNQAWAPSPQQQGVGQILVKIQKLQAQHTGLYLSHPSILQMCLFLLLKPPFWLSSEFTSLWSPSRCSCCWEADNLKHPCISFILWKKEGEDPIYSSAFLIVLADPLHVWVARFFHDAIPSSSFISLMKASKVSEEGTLSSPCLGGEKQKLLLSQLPSSLLIP